MTFRPYRTFTYLLVAFCLQLAGCGKDLPPDFPGGAVNSSTEFIEKLSKGQFDEAHGVLSDRMKSQKTVEQLTQDWKSLTSQKGDFQEVKEFSTDTTKEATSVLLTCSFKNGKSTISVLVTPDNRVDGIAFDL
jgi:predicted small lipoprotein YifL